MIEKLVNHKEIREYTTKLICELGNRISDAFKIYNEMKTAWMLSKSKPEDKRKLLLEQLINVGTSINMLAEFYPVFMRKEDLCEVKITLKHFKMEKTYKLDEILEEVSDESINEFLEEFK